MAVIETPVLLTSKNESGEKRLVYPITRADCVDGLEEVVDEKVAEKSISWNDLTDRPFGDNEDGTVKQLDNKYLSILDSVGGVVDIFVEQTLSFAYYQGFGAYRHTLNVAPFTLSDGQEYNIIWDGETYTRTAWAYTATDGSSCVAFGNPLVAGGENNGDEFAVVFDQTNNFIHFITTSTESSHTVYVYQTTPSTFKLKDEYRPDIPHFNLAEMGLGDPVGHHNSMGYVEADTTEIVAALEKGPVRFTVTINGSATDFVMAGGRYYDEIAVWYCDYFYDDTSIYALQIFVDGIVCVIHSLQSVLPDVSVEDDAGKVLTVKDGMWTAQELPSDLPEVTADDNGKVLSVADGAWSAQDAPTSLPSVTAEDEGKVLSVKDGVWTATEAPASDGGEPDILPEGEFHFTPDDDTGTLYAEAGELIGANVLLVDGKTYQVVWDGSEYTCLASTWSFGTATGIALGNLGLLGIGDTTDEPFIIGANESGAAMCYTSSTEASHTVRIYQRKSISWNDLTDKPFGDNADGTVKQLDNKYLSILDYQASTETDIIPECTPNLFIELLEGVYGQSCGEPGFLTVGENYTFVWDGTEYNVTAKQATLDGDTITYIGNISIAGLDETTDEPFVLFEDVANSNSVIATTVEGSSHTIRLYQITPETCYVKNEHLSILDKTEAKETEILPETSVTFTDGYGQPSSVAPFASGAMVRVIWDGTEYVLAAKDTMFDGIDVIAVGNDSIVVIGEDTGEPFWFCYAPSYNINSFHIASYEESTHSIQIYQTTPETYTLKEELIGNVDYETKIINKPFGQLAEAGAVVGEWNAEFEDADFGFVLSVPETPDLHPDDKMIAEGATYSVEIAGVTYEGVGVSAEMLKQNISSTAMAQSTNVGIAIYQDGNLWGALATIQNLIWFIVPISAEDYTPQEYYQVKITVVEAIKKIDAKYLPMDAIKAYIDEYIGEVLRGNY